MRKDSPRWTAARRLSAFLAISLGLASSGLAQQPAAATLTREAAVRQALAQNPYLTTIRKQSGYAEAALIIARTYPYNPVYTGYFANNNGPPAATVTNPLYLEQYVALEIELRGQRHHRRAIGCAAASRIEWEIANQEIAVSISVIRAYNAVLYRQQKLAFLDNGIKLGELAFEQVRKQADAGKIKATDLLLARVELDSARAQLGQARTALANARSDLRRVLGTLDDNLVVTGGLDTSLPLTDKTALTELALSQRADLQARRSAVSEAEATLRLVVANRFGNPALAPFYSYDNQKVTSLGGRISMPLAFINTKKGEIHKAETDVAKIRAEVQQMELQATQDVQAALARFGEASKWASAYQTEVLPDLRKAKQEMDEQFSKNDPRIEVPRLILLSRSFIKANENYLDALYEVSQAQADLALSTAEPSLAIGPGEGQGKR
jgi:outer membrane protein TolC